MRMLFVRSSRSLVLLRRQSLLRTAILAAAVALVSFVMAKKPMPTAPSLL